MNIPDYVVPIVGHRIWSWDTTAANHEPCSPLRSLNGNPWPVGRKLSATCFHPCMPSMQFERHQSPLESCRCGIYATKDVDQLQKFCGIGFGISGEVYLWGTVVEHQFGWRAQYAYPKSLVLSPETFLFQPDGAPSGVKRIQSCLSDLTRYGVDIFWAKPGKKRTLVWSTCFGYEVTGLESLKDAMGTKFSFSWVCRYFPAALRVLCEPFAPSAVKGFYRHLD